MQQAAGYAFPQNQPTRGCRLFHVSDVVRSAPKQKRRTASASTRCRGTAASYFIAGGATPPYTLYPENMAPAVGAARNILHDSTIISVSRNARLKTIMGSKNSRKTAFRLCGTETNARLWLLFSCWKTCPRQQTIRAFRHSTNRRH